VFFLLLLEEITFNYEFLFLYIQELFSIKTSHSFTIKTLLCNS